MQPTREPMTRAGAHVLAVDDDELVRAVLVRLLDHLGYRTTTAASAAEALDALGSHDDIALLVTDVRLAGGTDGCELARRGRELRPDLRVVFMSGLAPAELSDAVGDAPVLQKPFRRAELEEALARALG